MVQTHQYFIYSGSFLSKQACRSYPEPTVVIPIRVELDAHLSTKEEYFCAKLEREPQRLSSIVLEN